MKIAYLPFHNSQLVINFEKQKQNTCLLRYLFSEDGRDIIVCGKSKTLKDCVNLKSNYFAALWIRLCRTLWTFSP